MRFILFQDLQIWTIFDFGRVQSTYKDLISFVLIIFSFLSVDLEQLMCLLWPLFTFSSICMCNFTYCWMSFLQQFCLTNDRLREELWCWSSYVQERYNGSVWEHCIRTRPPLPPSPKQVPVWINKNQVYIALFSKYCSLKFALQVYKRLWN